VTIMVSQSRCEAKITKFLQDYAWFVHAVHMCVEHRDMFFCDVRDELISKMDAMKPELDECLGVELISRGPPFRVLDVPDNPVFSRLMMAKKRREEKA